MRLQVNRTSVGKAGGIGSKIGASIFGLFFGSIGLFIGTMGVRQELGNYQTRSWISTPCVIEEAVVEETGQSYTFKVRYSYEVDGVSYESKNYNHNDDAYSFEDVSKCADLRQRFKPGSNSKCFVNPQDPSQAVITRGGGLGGALAIAGFCSIFVLIGYGMVIGAWIPRRGRSLSRARKANSGKGFGFLFCSIFIAVGLVVTLFTFVSPLMKQQAAKQWDPVDAVVTRSFVKSHSSDDGTTYSVYIAYRYEVDGHIYEGDRYRFATGSSSGRASKQQVVGQYPKGTQFNVFVDPEDPQQSVILRDAGVALYLGLIPLVFSAFGFLFLVLILKGKTMGGGYQRHVRKHKDPRSARGTMHGGQQHETVFKPSTSRVGSLIGILCAALFWNGIVSVFVVAVVKDWMSGRKPIGTTLFMSIFVLIGMGLIFGVFYQILRLFNPRVQMTGNGCVFYPGATNDVTFQIIGNVNKLRRLEVKLLCTEKARYRRGTDTVTATEQIHEEVLLDESSTRMMQRGAMRISIPPGAMHSFKSSNNEVEWLVSVKGDIPKWPDMSASYTLNVVPRELIS